MMLLKNFNATAFLLAIFLFASVGLITAQSVTENDFYYLSPVPGAKMVRPETNIILKSKFPEKLEMLKNNIQITGSRSGRTTFETRCLETENALIIYPDEEFCYDEKITLTIKDQETANTNFTPSFSYHFYIMKQPVKQHLHQAVKRADKKIEKSSPDVNGDDRLKYDLPDDFPEYEITQKDNPSPGYFFLAPLKWSGDAHYTIILDNMGFPVFYRKNPGSCYDFKLQPNGEITYFLSTEVKFVKLNSKFEQTGFYAMGNGYSTDLHECNVTGDGHVFMLGYDPQIVDMDTVVEGGQPGAIVIGLIVQEQDPAGNVIFQWRSWDHFQITDAVDWIDLTADNIEWKHRAGNAKTGKSMDCISGF
jgi:hypothetical protein